MTEILLRAGSFVLILCMGYGMKKAGLFKADDYRILTKIVLNVTLPAAIIVNFSAAAISASLLWIILAGFLANIVLFLSALPGGKKVPWKMKMLRMVNYPGYSIGCFALPFVQNFLGPMGVVTTCLFDAGNSLMCTGTTYAIVSAMDEKRKKGKGQVTVLGSLAQIGKKMLHSAPLMTFLVMFLLDILKLSVPGPVLTVTQTIANANAFLAMFMIGMMFEIRMDRSKKREMIRLLSARLFFGICLALAFYYLLPLPIEIRKTAALIVFAPMSATALVFTDRLGCDTELASACNSFSILISLVGMTAISIAFFG